MLVSHTDCRAAVTDEQKALLPVDQMSLESLLRSLGVLELQASHPQ